MILIIGAGWYGCHLAKFLLEKSIPFVIYEASNEIFSASSFFNQNRLHLGFHYPRSHKTRKLCVENFDRFLQNYEFVTEKIDKNIYYISKHSCMDYQTFISIYKYEKIPFKTEPFTFEQNMDGEKILVNERFIDPKKIKTYFSNLLKDKIVFNRKVLLDEMEVLTQKFSLILNCTMGRFNYKFSHDYIYEKTVSLLYRQIEKNSIAYTVMDGKFFSLYPQDLENNIYSLTDVEYTPFITSSTPIEDFEINIDQKKSLFETKFKEFMSDFSTHYSYEGYFISDKIKIKSDSDSRELVIEKKDNVISFICGKIPGIFEAEEYLYDLLFNQIN